MALLVRPPPNSPNKAPGVSEMDLPGVSGPESATQNEMSSLRRSSSLSSWSCALSRAELGVTANDRGVTVTEARITDGDSLFDKFHSSHQGGSRSRRWALLTHRFSSTSVEIRKRAGFRNAAIPSLQMEMKILCDFLCNRKIQS